MAIMEFLDDGRKQKLVEAVATLENAMLSGEIRNVAFSDAKYCISLASEAALKAAFDGDLRNEARHNYSFRYDLIDQYVNPRHAGGNLKKIQKAFSNPSVAMQKYMEVLADVASLGEVLKAAKPFIVKGRAPKEVKNLDLSGTATCAICGGTFKVDNNQKMVHHGFRISDGRGNYLGVRKGTCFGVGYLPYELSCEANKAYLPRLESELAGMEKSLEDFKSNPPDTLMDREWSRMTMADVVVTLEKGMPQYTKRYNALVFERETNIRFTKSEICDHLDLIKQWTLKPLLHGDLPKRFNKEVEN